MVNRKLGRTSAHRKAMFRNQLASLIDRERIITTLPKAKELRPLIERLITLGKTDNVHNRRHAARVIADNGLIGKLFTNLGPRFAERPGGYTRIIKIGPRRGDAAEMAILEFMGYELDAADTAAEAPVKSSPKKAAPKKAAKPAKEDSDDADTDETPKKKTAAKKAAPKKPAKENKKKPASPKAKPKAAKKKKP